jgi:hypothetical protein
MADEPRPLSRRERRESEARAGAPGSVSGELPTVGGREPPPERESPRSGRQAGSTAEASAITGERPPVASKQPSPTVTQSPEIHAGFAFTTELPLASAAAVSTPQPNNSDGSLSRRDRRRLERLEQPMETWTAEEEQRHTGQVPTMTPEVIAQQEALARQRAAAAQQDARLATGGIPLVEGAPSGGQPGGLAPAGGVPAALQHLFPPAAYQGGQPPPPPAQPQNAPRRPQPAQPSIDSHGRLIAPDGSQVFDVPSLVDGQPSGEIPIGDAAQGAAVPQSDGYHAAAFEAMVAGGAPPTQGKPPTIHVPQVPGPFQPPGPFAPPGPDAVAAMSGPPTGQYPIAPGGMVAPGAGQAMVVPGTGTLRTTQGTGTIRSIPGTGAIPRPIVEVQPAGGLRHFGWAHLSLLAAAAFALGLVVYTVATAQGN